MCAAVMRSQRIRRDTVTEQQIHIFFTNQTGYMLRFDLRILCVNISEFMIEKSQFI